MAWKIAVFTCALLLILAAVGLVVAWPYIVMNREIARILANTPVPMFSQSLKRPPPKDLLITYKTIDDIPQKTVDMWKRALSPTWTVHLFGNKECAAYLRSHYDEDDARLFEQLPHGPIKADVFRVFFLYRTGGVYVDVDMVVRKPQIEQVLLRPMNQLLTVYTPSSRRYNPTLIVAQKRDPFLRMAMHVYRTMFSTNVLYTYMSYSIVSIFTKLAKKLGKDAPKYLLHPFTERIAKQKKNNVIVDEILGDILFDVRADDYQNPYHGLRTLLTPPRRIFYRS
jgi:hypothetical protein